jgi:hypothetical protein
MDVEMLSEGLIADRETRRTTGIKSETEVRMGIYNGVFDCCLRALAQQVNRELAS